MQRSFNIFVIFIITFLFAHCKRVLEPPLSQNLLIYEHTHGWTGKISIINVFNYYHAFKIINDMEIPIEFSSDEIQKLKEILAKYSSFKRFYQPENGIWSDIPTHEIIYYGEVKPDSVSIYEPLDSPDIPMDLVNLVELLMSKLWEDV